MLVALFFVHQAVQDGGLFVSGAESIDKSDFAMLSRLGTNFQPDAFKSVKAQILVKGNTAYAFDEPAWQGTKIAAQTKLYTDLAAGRLNSDSVRGCELSAFLRSNGPVPKKFHPNVVVERHFWVERAGEKIEVVISSSPNARAQVELDFPKAVVPYRATVEAQSPWVQYLTTYSFRGFGKVYSDHDRYYEARKQAIAIIDKHIDEFMEKRSRRREAIAVSIENVLSDGLIGKRLDQAAPDIAHRLMTGLAKGDPPKPSAWAAGATITNVELRLLLFEQMPDGSSVAVVVP